MNINTNKECLSLLEPSDNKIPILIQLINHEGSIVPLISCPDRSRLEKLSTYLKENAVEVLDQDNYRSLLIYTKLYTQEEMDQAGLKGFHCGYSIKSFFEKFKELIPYVNKENYHLMKDFLSEEDRIDDYLN